MLVFFSDGKVDVSVADRESPECSTALRRSCCSKKLASPFLENSKTYYSEIVNIKETKVSRERNVSTSKFCTGSVSRLDIAKFWR